MSVWRPGLHPVRQAGAVVIIAGLAIYDTGHSEPSSSPVPLPHTRQTPWLPVSTPTRIPRD